MIYNFSQEKILKAYYRVLTPYLFAINFDVNSMSVFKITFLFYILKNAYFFFQNFE